MRLLALSTCSTCIVCMAGCARLPRYRAAGQSASAAPVSVAQTSSSAPPVDINRASAAELERLPGIGAGFAERIIEHRKRYGAFRRKEHLLMVRGMGERRYAALESLIVAGAP